MSKSDSGPGEPSLKREEIWKKEIIKQHLELLEEDCAQFFQSHGDPVGAGIAEWLPCVFCGGEEFIILFHQHAYHWGRCPSCGLLQKRPRPGMQAMSQFYTEGKAVPFFEEKVLRADRKIREKKIFGPNLDRLSLLAEENCRAGGALLDIGCSSGLFLAAARERGLFSRYAGVEPNGPSAAQARNLGFTIYPVMFEDAEIQPESYDVITCFAMFQFIWEPLAFLKKCKTILRPGGFVIFTSSNGWAPDILLLQKFSPVLPCHMLQLPDPNSFKQLCLRAGLSEVQVEALGQLDVQLVQETWQESPPDISNPITEFLYRIFVDLNTPELAGDLQNFLKKHNLSGHLWMQARKV